MSKKLQLIQGILNCTRLSDFDKELIIQQYLLNWINDYEVEEKIKNYK